MDIKEIKQKLSQEWNKPKGKNISKIIVYGEAIDKRQPRNYATIKDLQKDIRDYKLKTKSCQKKKS